MIQKADEIETSPTNPSPEDELVVITPDDETETTPGRIARVVFILLMVAMLSVGLWWNQKRIREQVKGPKPDNGAAGMPDTPAWVDPNQLDPPPVEVYGWGPAYDAAGSIAGRIPTPEGFVRVPVREATIQQYLRYLPLRAGEQQVHFAAGHAKRNQTAHHAVIDIDSRSSQEAAQAVVRLWAEYLLANGQAENIRFRLDDGRIADFGLWQARQGGEDHDEHVQLMAFLDDIASLVSTETLAEQCEPLASPADVEIGDMLINPGKPGHVAIVVDVAFRISDADSRHTVYLLAQGGTPAQDLHVLVNPSYSNLTPWYPLVQADGMRTPEYTFPQLQFYRFQPAR